MASAAATTSATGRFASGAWLTPSLTTFVAVLMLAGSVIALAFLFLTATGTADALGRPLGTDFSSFWTAGRMALAGKAAAAYDWTVLAAFQRETHGVEGFVPWSYPPMFLLVAAALAVLPYVPALLVWQAAGAAAALTVFRRILPGRRALLLATAFPAVLVCLGHGQTGFLTAALLAGGVLALQRREVFAGVLFGLLAYKPQLGVLLPFVLAAGGYWRAFASAAATVVGCIGVTLAVWGWPVWQAFADALPLIGGIAFEDGSTGFFKFQSAFAWMRLWGASLAVAYTVQAVVSAGVLVGCVWVWRSAAELRLKGAALITGALLCSPYMLDYDLVAFGMALAFLAAHGMAHGFRRWEQTLLALAWFMPLVARELARLTYMPVGFLVLAAIFALVLLRVRDGESAPAHASAAVPLAATS
jgi:hypothetical protein